MHTKTNTLFLQDLRKIIPVHTALWGKWRKLWFFPCINCSILDPDPSSHMCILYMNNLQQKEFARIHKEDKNVSIFHIWYIVAVQVVFTS